MRRAVLSVVLLAAAGCAAPRAPAPPPPGVGEDPEVTLRGDVMVDGRSILGAWYAVEVVGDATATRDLESGTMEQTLIVSSNGRAILTGIDRREGGDPVAFTGQVRGSSIRFAAMEGAGTLLMSGRRLVLRDPNGRSTVFVRER